MSPGSSSCFRVGLAEQLLDGVDGRLDLQHHRLARSTPPLGEPTRSIEPRSPYTEYRHLGVATQPNPLDDGGGRRHECSVSSVEQAVELAALPSGCELDRRLQRGEDAAHGRHREMVEVTAFESGDGRLRDPGCPGKVRLAQAPPTTQYPHRQADPDIFHGADSDVGPLIPRSFESRGRPWRWRVVAASRGRGGLDRYPSPGWSAGERRPGRVRPYGPAAVPVELCTGGLLDRLGGTERVRHAPGDCTAGVARDSAVPGASPEPRTRP